MKNTLNLIILHKKIMKCVTKCKYQLQKNSGRVGSGWSHGNRLISLSNGKKTYNMETGLQKIAAVRENILQCHVSC